MKRLRCHQIEGKQLSSSNLLTKQANKNFAYTPFIIWDAAMLNSPVYSDYGLKDESVLANSQISAIDNRAHIIRFLNFFVFATF